MKLYLHGVREITRLVAAHFQHWADFERRFYRAGEKAAQQSKPGGAA